MSQTAIAGSELPVPRHSLGLWLASTFIVLGVWAYAARQHRTTWLWVGVYLFFVLPMIYGTLAWLAKVLSFGVRPTGPETPSGTKPAAS